MNAWRFEILDENGTILAMDDGYETESEAEQCGMIAAKAMGLGTCTVRTSQFWVEL